MSLRSALSHVAWCPLLLVLACSPSIPQNSRPPVPPAAKSDHSLAGAPKGDDQLTYVEQHTTPAVPGTAPRKVDEFTLDDFYGAPHSLSDFADRPILVLVFLGADCPLARLYAPKIQALAEKYEARRVAFLAIDSNVQDSISEMREYALAHELKLPLLRDNDNQIADRCGATRNPEVIVLDTDRIVRYQGRIDDEFGFYEGTGYQRVRKVRDHLAVALDELLAGKPVSQPLVPAPGCVIGRRRQPSSEPVVTWSRDVAPLVQRKCQACHRPDTTAPFSLLTYEDTVGWAEMMLEVVETSRMPPWHANPKYGKFINDARLSDQEKQLIRDWVSGGAAEGDPRDLPPPRHFGTNTTIANPDLVMYISDEPNEIPAHGLPHFNERILDLQFKQDTWIDSIECRPDNKSVVHHMDVIVAPAGDFDEHMRAGRGRRMGGYVPGLDLTLMSFTGESEGNVVRPPEPRIFIPAGSQMLIDVHYKPNGRLQKDRSSVAIRFSPPPAIPAVATETQTEASVSSTFQEKVPSGVELAVGEQSVLIEDTEFCIPPNVAEYKATALLTLMYPTELRALHAHMHVRGKSMLFEAFYPDGTQEILLDVPRYDYNWESLYALAEPKKMPPGTRLRVTTVFDNSADNPHNPDPDVAVFYGRGYYDQEMMSGTVTYYPHIVGFTREETLLIGDRTRQQPLPQDIVNRLLASYLSPVDVPHERKKQYYLQRGQFCKELGDFVGAVADFDQAIVVDSTFIAAYLERANVRVQLNQLPAAFADFNKVIELDPKNVAGYLGRGGISGDARASIRDFETVLRLDPRNAEAVFSRGLARQAAGDVVQALADFTLVTDQLNPGHLQSYIRRGALLLDQGRDVEAQAQFDIALKLRPATRTSIDFWQGVGNFKQRRYAEALVKFDRYLKIVPESHTVLKLKGRALLELNRYSEAIVSLTSLVNIASVHDSEAWHLLAIAERRQSELDSNLPRKKEAQALAISHLKKALEVSATYLPAAFELADVYSAQGRTKAVVTTYREILRAQPAQSEASMKLAWLLATHADPAYRDGSEAVRLAEQACRFTEMRNPKALGVLAAAFAETGRFDDAIRTVLEAIKLAQANGSKDLVLQLTKQRASYEARKPLHRTIGPQPLG